MGALDYAVDLEDMRFVLFEQLRVQEELATVARYEDFDRDTLDATLDEARRIAIEVLAPINAVGDKQGCTLDGDGNVTTPDGFQEAWDLMAEGGWIAVGADPEVGGFGLPSAPRMAVLEMFTGAAMAYMMYPGLTGAAARVLQKFGPEGMSDSYAERMNAGEWGGTMCLTEAGAGSDVGENRSKAEPIEGEPGVYSLTGEKIFITGGDHDLASNIMHLVLARTPGSPPGTKGLSLFLVPKFLVNDDGSNGARNGAYVVGIEEKMGIHGSSTCTLSLGDRGTCRGWLVGTEHEGIKVMFHMMNEARIGVGAQGVAMSAAAYQYALAYAKERLQGSAIESFRDPAAPRVPILEHADVRRMLMTMKVYTETMRSMLYRLGHRHDMAETDPDLHDRYMGRVDFLVPILKSACSDIGFEMCVLGTQVLGGYGYIGEYPLEQLVRDAKITSIYEGTNGIQAMDLLGRKMRIDNGRLFMEWMQDAQKECALAREVGLADEADALEKAIQHAGATAMHLGGLGAQGKLEATMLQATPFLQMMSGVHLGLEALNQARTAAERIAADGETKHRTGKLANLKFYVANLLPKAVAAAKSIQAGDESCLDDSLWT